MLQDGLEYKPFDNLDELGDLQLFPTVGNPLDHFVNNPKDNFIKIKEEPKDEPIYGPPSGSPEDSPQNSSYDPEEKVNQMLSIQIRDPKMNRKLKNRHSAQISRQRKKVYIQNLEVKQEKLLEANHELELRETALKAEHAVLKEQLAWMIYHAESIKKNPLFICPDSP